MAIRFDLPDIDQVCQNTINDVMTICKVHNGQHNTLLLHIPQVFPEYKKLTTGTEIYFWNINEHVYLSLTEPTDYKGYLKRKIQWYGNQTKQVYYRIPIPIQIRKHFKIENPNVVRLKQLGNCYECVFV